jgi:hypothetical protein
MKFLKQKTISRYSPSDNTLFTNHYGRAVMDLTGGLRLPKGTTSERPDLSGVRTPNGADGYIRYNTETNSIEAYVAGVWEIVTAPGTTGITKQTLGPGNETDTIFGPLTLIPPSENSILVLVENVFQISDTNFNILYNYLGSGNAYIEFTSAIPLDKYITIYYGFSN